MLISFSAGNFLSFRDKTELSMVAVESDHSLPDNMDNTLLVGKKTKPLRLLKSAVIYGPNAGGKSNYLGALSTFSAFIVSSANMHENEPSPFTSFALEPQKRLSPSEFETKIFLDGILYRYGFSADARQIHDEWLFISDKGKERFVFERAWNRDSSRHSYEFGPSGKLFEKFYRDGAIRNNALLLSVASQGNVGSAKKIVDYMSRAGAGRKYSIGGWPIEDCRHIPLLTSALQFADIGINSINTTELSSGRTAQKQPFFNPSLSLGINNLEFVYLDSERKKIPLPASSQSSGTHHFFALIMMLVKIYENKGGLLVIDELDRSLHPVLTEAFLKFIHQLPDSRLQLICTTHNPLLLNQDVFRRDQIWIAEKDKAGVSALTAFSDFKGLRKEHRLGKQYLEGRFGGLPIPNSFALEKMLQQLAELLGQESR